MNPAPARSKPTARRFRLRCGVCILLLTSLLVGAAGAATRKRQPPSLPTLPGRTLATLPVPALESGWVTRYLTAQLDGRPGQELVVLSGDPGNVRLRVYTWNRHAFHLLADRTAYLDRTFAAVDLDGDRREELIGIDTANRIVTLRYERGKLRATEAGPRIDAAIGSLTATSIRRKGAAELAIAIDKDQPPEPGADVQCDRLLFFRRTGGRWRQSWHTSIAPLQFRVELHSGDFHPQPGSELLVAHLPSEVSDSHYELLRWTGTRLARVTRIDSDARTPVGLQHWIGALRWPGHSPALVSHTSYMPDENGTERGELLQWRRGGLRATHRLPGAPVAVGDFDGSGRPAILFEKEDRLTVWRPVQPPARAEGR